MFDDKFLLKLSKWIVGVFTCCILIFLGIKYFDVLTATISSLIGLAMPLILGIIFALILNVPMGFIERNIKNKVKKGVRPLSILLSILMVAGILVGICVLVIPELVQAIRLIIEITMDFLDAASNYDAKVFDFIPSLNIDWEGIKNSLETWAITYGKNIMNSAANMVGSVVSGTVNFFVSLVFAVYILSAKEKLKGQVARLIHAWLPEKAGHYIIHVGVTCNRIFKLYVAGQATEAVILGTLCMIGMLILGMPYAPMIGALVGVTALIPIVGAFVGCGVGFIMILTVSPFKAIIFVVFFLILQQVEGNLIYPRVVGSKVNLPAIWVLAAITIGGNISGILGMLFAVPVTSALYTFVKEGTVYMENKKNNNVHV
ncbi:MAG: AI-2E family transporter [Erysipelotrichaceae bacterium]|uniref:AI-2E family transporter n=1 Tax=Floccifex sp. TaxID=2815810 RepID=UPI0029FF300B|nr:AI-2E family transporter [Floccifex sp.]MDD7282276.1 AI-2E family transporter [Erysipelotrichaceae bacterium]MDY2958224.1 AI-2E family transporter [Floccifex sp.]